MLNLDLTARPPRAFRARGEIVEMNKDDYWPYTPNTNLLYGLHEALEMIESEGLPRVFARHQRWGAGVRAAVEACGLPIQCADPAAFSPVLTGVEMGLKLVGIKLAASGVQPAMDHFSNHPAPAALKAAA